MKRTKARPATSTRGRGCSMLRRPWWWIPGPSTGVRSLTRGVRAFAPSATPIPRAGAPTSFGTTHHGTFGYVPGLVPYGCLAAQQRGRLITSSAAEDFAMGGELPTSEARTDTGSPASDRPRPSLRLLRWWAMAAWGCWLALVGLLWGQ